MVFFLQKSLKCLLPQCLMHLSFLHGGAAGLARLPEAIYTALHIPCGVADDPQTSVVLGCGIAVEDPGAYASLLDDGRKGFKRL